MKHFPGESVMMQVDIVEDEGRCIGLVRVQGGFGTAVLDEFRRYLGVMMAPDKNVRHYVMDLARVDDFDRASIGSFLFVLRRIRDMEGDIRLSCIQPEVGEVLSFAKADEIFRIYKTRGEAVRSYREVV